MPPAWALPNSRSLPTPPRPKLSFWRLNVFSRKPRWYDQSCIRLCMANRLARAASMSLRSGEVKVVSGLHDSVNHWLVHG
jgi:hypothetical protein